MKTKFITAMVVSTTIIFFSFINVNNNDDRVSDDEQAVKSLVLGAYVNGAFNTLDAESMEQGFHKDFAIYSPKGDEISKYKIADWVAGVKKRRAGDYDPDAAKNKWEHKFAAVDVTGHAAQVKIELHNQGKHVYTDYLSLLRFGDEWKIVAKVYYKHD